MKTVSHAYFLLYHTETLARGKTFVQRHYKKICFWQNWPRVKHI